MSGSWHSEPCPNSLWEGILWFSGRKLWYWNWLDVENEIEREMCKRSFQCSDPKGDEVGQSGPEVQATSG